jgi:hypothetical protein
MGNGRISRLRTFAARVSGLCRPRKRDSDLDEEVRSHLQLLTDRFVAQGMSGEDAAAAARRQFGNTTLLQDEEGIAQARISRGSRARPTLRAAQLGAKSRIRSGRHCHAGIRDRRLDRDSA